MPSEMLYVTPSVSEHTEMYLKAMAMLEEEGEKDAKISSIAKMLGISPPSVVQMLTKLSKQGLIKYSRGKGSRFRKKGKVMGGLMLRNSRLVETLMDQALKMEVDEKVSCALEHHMTKEFADALCRLLGHPRACPHGNAIPKGECCQE